MNPFRFNVFRSGAADKESNYFAFLSANIFFFFRKWERRRDIIYLLMMVLHAINFIAILFINLIVTVN